MTRIILSADQAIVLHTTSDIVELCDPEGTVVGYVSRPFGQADIDEANRRLASGGPWYTTKEVIAHLDSLDSK